MKVRAKVNPETIAYMVDPFLEAIGKAGTGIFLHQGNEGNEDSPRAPDGVGPAAGRCPRLRVCAGKEQTAGCLASCGQGLEEVVTIHGIEEDRLLPVSSAHHVMEGTGVFQAVFSRHNTATTLRRNLAGAKTNRVMADPFHDPFHVA
jgi:hypothetical protein